MKQTIIENKAKCIANQLYALLPDLANSTSVEASLINDIGFRANIVWQLHHLDPMLDDAYDPLINQINCLDCMLQ